MVDDNEKVAPEDLALRPYEAPEIRELGRLVDLTRGGEVIGANDDGFDGGTIPV